eukprot:PhM_4_TR15081/c0_g1_i1/m.16861/K03424/tatD; TatD DNase family protein
MSLPPINGARRAFYDVAVNLTDCVFRGVSWKGKQVHADDLDAVLARAAGVGVTTLLVSGTTIQQSLDAIRLCAVKNKEQQQQQQPPNSVRLCCTVGIHPSHAHEVVSPISELFDSVFQSDDIDLVVVVRAIGELGLDYAELDEASGNTKQVQRRVFEDQLEAAVTTPNRVNPLKVTLPFFFHSRDCGLDFVEVLNASPPPVMDALHRRGGVVHSFTGPFEELDAVLTTFGLSVSLSGASLRSASYVSDVIVRGLFSSRTGFRYQRRLMLETDAPWCDVRPTHDGHKFISKETSCRFTVAAAPEKLIVGSPSQVLKRRHEPCQLPTILEALCGLVWSSAAWASGEEKRAWAAQVVGEGDSTLVGGDGDDAALYRHFVDHVAQCAYENAVAMFPPP